MIRRPILFCATGVETTVGGIASANLNIRIALARVAEETGRSLHTMTLSEAIGQPPAYASFGGNKAAFAAASLISAPRSALMVFDHVRLSEPALALPRWARGKVVVCAHGSEATWRIRPSSVRAYQKAELVMTNSHYTLTRMADYVTGFNGQACPLGLSPRFELSAAPPPSGGADLTLEAADGQARPLGDQVLLLVSRLDASEREKGHRELNAVLPRVLERHPGAQLVLVGDGSDLGALKAEAAASSAAASIFLPGRMEKDALTALYRKAYAYVMPSRQEGFGLVYLEAMNQARPCLACRDDGGGEVVVDRETGVLVPRAFSDDDLFAALDHLLVDPARARGYGEAGWRRLVDHYTAKAHQDRVAALVRPLLA